MDAPKQLGVSGPLATAVLVTGPVSTVSLALALQYTGAVAGDGMALDLLLVVGNTLFGIAGFGGLRLPRWMKALLIALYVPAAIFLSVFPAIVIGCAVYNDCL